MTKRPDFPNLYLVMDVAKATSQHFKNCDFGKDWPECEHCVLVYNRISRILEYAEPLIRNSMDYQAKLETAATEKLRQRVQEAVQLAVDTADKAVTTRQKMWVIDQMTRILAGDSYDLMIMGRLDPGIKPEGIKQ